MKINFKHFIIVVLTILVVVLPCVAVESRSFCVVALILWPIVAFTLAFLKARNFNNNNLDKIGKKGLMHKFEEEDNLKEN